MNTAYPLPIPKSPPMTFTVKIKIALGTYRGMWRICKSGHLWKSFLKPVLEILQRHEGKGSESVYGEDILRLWYGWRKYQSICAYVMQSKKEVTGLYWRFFFSPFSVAPLLSADIQHKYVWGKLYLRFSQHIKDDIEVTFCIDFR